MGDSDSDSEEERKQARQRQQLAKRRSHVHVKDLVDEEEDEQERLAEKGLLAEQLAAQERLARAAQQVRMVTKMQFLGLGARERLAGRFSAPKPSSPQGSPSVVKPSGNQSKSTPFSLSASPPVISALNSPRLPSIVSPSRSRALFANAAEPQTLPDGIPASPRSAHAKAPVKTEGSRSSILDAFHVTAEENRELKRKETRRMAEAVAEDEVREREIADQFRFRKETEEKVHSLQEEGRAAFERAETDAGACKLVQVAKVQEIGRMLAAQEDKAQEAKVARGVQEARFVTDCAEQEAKMVVDRDKMIIEKKQAEEAREEVKRGQEAKKKAEEELLRANDVDRLKLEFDQEQLCLQKQEVFDVLFHNILIFDSVTFAPTCSVDVVSYRLLAGLTLERGVVQMKKKSHGLSTLRFRGMIKPLGLSTLSFVCL